MLLLWKVRFLTLVAVFSLEATVNATTCIRSTAILGGTTSIAAHSCREECSWILREGGGGRDATVKGKRGGVGYNTMVKGYYLHYQYVNIFKMSDDASLEMKW